MVTLRPLTDAAALTGLLQRQPLQPFLQSWAWGDFQHELGRSVFRIGAYDDRDQLVGALLAIRHEIILGKSYLYCPRGPLADTPEVLRALFQALRQLGEHEQAMYVKVDPGLYHFSDDILSLAEGYSIGTALQPQQTIVLDTKQSPVDMMAGMHPKTRYNIRLAQKKGVNVRWSTSDGDLADFLRLMHQTAARQGIRFHSDAYYRRLFSTMLKHQQVELVVGDFEGQVRAAHMIIWHGQTATYLHGGSDDAHKDAMVPYLLQWATIQKAHERGVTEYDLWGVAPDDIPNHKLAGVTRFKRGFSGRQIVFPSSMNAVLQPQWYQAYRLAKRIRGGVDE